MTEWIDITMPLSRDMAVFAGNDQPKIERTAFFEDGADSITSILTTDLHNGTHIDAPFHFLADGDTIEKIDLSVVTGEAAVIEIADDVDQIDASALANVVPEGTTRVLLKTRNSRHIGNSRHVFNESFVALTTDASQWLVDHGIRLVGIDYLSIALFGGEPETHRVLLRNGVVVVEGLALEDVAAGEYELNCLPLKINDAEAAPARALLRPLV